MKKLSTILLLLISFTASSSSPDVKTMERLKDKAKLAKAYCIKNNMDLEVCILVDMQIHSGKKRLFLWDFKGDSILKSGVCSHGTCNETTPSNFSNVPNSHCSSLGKYKLGKRVYSTFGVNYSYKLHGLESTNSKAYDRVIVFHSWDIIEEEEVYPNEIVESWGCPSISNQLMIEMDEILKNKKKSVLFWIYN